MGKVGFATVKPIYYAPDFTRFSLQVATSPALTAVSQGKESKPKKGSFKFLPEYPLQKISLLIGDYKKYQIRVDSVNYSLYTIKGNQYFERYFTQMKDTMAVVISDLKREYETKIELEYPFKRFSLAEVPVQFPLTSHIWSTTTEGVQPEMIFYQEKGVLFAESDFKRRKTRTEKDMKRNNEETLPDDLQTRMFQQFVRNNFMTKSMSYSLFPEYFSFATSFKLDKWPVLGMALESYIKDRASLPYPSNVYNYNDPVLPDNINQELKQASLKLMILSSRYGQTEFDQTLHQLITHNTFKTISFNDLNKQFQNIFIPPVEKNSSGDSQNALPGFLFKEINTYKVAQGNYIKYQVCFKVANAEPYDGIITINVDLSTQNQQQDGNQKKSDFSKLVYVPANSAREVGMIFHTQPVSVSVFTHTSLNNPDQVYLNLTGFNVTKKIHSCDMPSFKDVI